MGRHIDLYIIPKDIPHDANKPMCLELECEPETYEIEELIYSKLRPENSKKRLAGIDFMSHQKEMKALTERYMWGKKSGHDVWCPTCRLYAHGFYDSPLVMKNFSVSHSYRNPIVGSVWNIKDLYLGKSSTDFARRFNPDKMIREISASDVEEAFEKIERLGTPHRTTDKDAKEEALDMLEFLMAFKDDPDVRMIISDDF